jgi:hypothetical protein
MDTRKDDYNNNNNNNDDDDDNTNDKNNNSIQFNSYLFACQLNSPRANYKVSTSKRKETNIRKVQTKEK